MKNKSLSYKIKRNIKIRWYAFKRRPLTFLRYLFLILFFRCLGIIICLFLTVIPLPLNNLLQNLLNLNLSLNSFKDIMLSVKQIANNFNHLLPSLNDISRLIKSVLTNINPVNLINIVRDIPSDLRQFFLQFFEHLRQRLKDLQIFFKSLWPLKELKRKFKIFIKAHTIIIKRIVKNLFMMIFSILFVKILFFLIIPLLGIGAIYFIGIDISLIIIGILSLISSQLGSLIGRLMNNLLLKLYEILQKKSPKYKLNLLMLSVALIYSNLKNIILKVRLYTCQIIVIYINNIRLSLLIIYLYYKHYVNFFNLKRNNE